jgi:hypothetical protein
MMKTDINRNYEEYKSKQLKFVNTRKVKVLISYDFTSICVDHGILCLLHPQLTKQLTFQIYVYL